MVSPVLRGIHGYPLDPFLKFFRLLLTLLPPSRAGATRAIPYTPMSRSSLHLLIFHLAGALGGAEQTSLLLVRHMRGCFPSARVTLVGSELLRPLLGPYCDCFIDGNAQGLGYWFTDLAKLRQDVARASEILKAEGPNLVLGMMHYGAALAVLGGRRCGGPLRTLASLRGPAYEYLRRHEPERRRRLFLRAAISTTGWGADRVLVPSAGTGHELTRRFLVPPWRIEVIPNGIDQTAALAAAQAPTPELVDLPPGQPVVCALARLSAEKDLGLLLDAFGRARRRHPANLLVVGDGPERSALEAQAVALGLGKAVRFLGYRANVFPYLARADLFVHTCQFEGFGYTLLEAMTCGLPVVATDCPYGPREVVGTAQCGFLVPPGDSEALAQALLTLLNDPQLRRQMGANARERAAVLSVKAMMDRYTSLFTRLTGIVPG